MKKLSLTLAALALVLGMSQCKKQEEPVQNGEKQHIVLNASFAESNSKIAEDGIGGLKWSDEDGNEDHIIVKNSSQEKIGELECTDAENGIFEGDITSTTGNITFTFGEEKYMEQTGELNAAMHLTSPEVEYRADGNYENVQMSISNAVLKLDVSALGTSGLLTIAAGGEIVASVTDVSGIASAVFVAVPTDETEKAYTITCGGKTATKTWKLEKNVFYTKAGAEGAGTGEAIVIKPTPKFTVGENTTVEFSPGNLYWDGSAFRFEANQWDTKPAYSETEEGSGTWVPSHVSHFKWSDKDKAVTGDETYSGVLFCASNFTVDGDIHTDWRTLSDAEWNYLLNTSGSSGRTDASRFAKAKVNNVCGLLIFPDGYKGTTSGDGIATLNAKAAAYPTDNILPNTWKSMESAGAVFLPAAGFRYGTDVYSVGSDSYYWSGTPLEGRAYCMGFSSDLVGVSYDARYYGFAVRLVR